MIGDGRSSKMRREGKGLMRKIKVENGC